jgi:hypothetical protein
MASADDSATAPSLAVNRAWIPGSLPFLSSCSITGAIVFREHPTRRAVSESDNPASLQAPMAAALASFRQVIDPVKASALLAWINSPSNGKSSAEKSSGCLLNSSAS